MEELPKKDCIRCHQEKYLFEFYRCKRNFDGLMAACKMCSNKSFRESREKHQPKNVEKMRWKNCFYD